MSQPQKTALDRAGVNIEAEHAVLGLVLFEGGCKASGDQASTPILDQLKDLKPEHFYEPLHALIWDAIVDMASLGRPAEMLAVHGCVKVSPGYEGLGGLRYLADLVDRAPIVSSARSWAEQIIDAANLRAMVSAAQEMLQEVAAAPQSAPQAITGLRQKLDLIAANSAVAEDHFRPLNELALQSLDQMDEDIATGRIRGLRCGLKCIDQRLGGLKPGWVIIGAGRPGMGKTAYLRSVLQGGAIYNPDHVFPLYSQEMSGEELADRAISAMAMETADERIPYQEIGNRTVKALESHALRKAAERLPSNVLVDSRPGRSLDDILRGLWGLRRRGLKIGAVGIDYLQLMRLANDNRNTTEKIGDITRGLKAAAAELGCAVILLSQLSRLVEQRDDKRPQLSDLRASGDIEQDAVAVQMLYRHDYYLEQAEPKAGSKAHQEWEMELMDAKGRLEVITRKLRHGKTGTDKQRCDLAVDLIWNEDRGSGPIDFSAPRGGQ